MTRPPRDERPGLTPGAIVRLDLADMAYGGDAVGRADGAVVFAWGGIRGEQVDARIDRVKRDLAWGSVTEVRAPAPERVAPACPYFGPCGGCQWQHISYPGQLEFKTHVLREQLRRVAGLDSAHLDEVLQPALGMDEPWAYRNVSHFQVDAATRKLGYFQRNSHTVVAVDVCPISDPGINDMLARAQALFNDHAQAPGDLPANISALDLEAVRRGQMPIALRQRKVTGMPVWQVTIRTGAPPNEPVAADSPWAGRQMVVVLHTLSGDKPPGSERRGRRSAEEEAPRPTVLLNRKAVRHWVAQLPGQVSVVELRQDGSLELVAETAAASAASGEDSAQRIVPGLVSGSRRAAAQHEAGDEPEAPPAVVRQRLGGGPYWLAPQAFFQVNNAQAETILRLVRAALPAPVDLLVDAYSGAGAYALALLASGDARRVVAIESDWPAVESARWTATLREIDPAALRLERGRVEDVLPRLRLEPDIVLLDPPRAGCAPALLQHLLTARVPRLIYVSCDPSTLARDIRTLSSGYRLISAQPVDMFPQTYHVETVAVLDALPAPPDAEPPPPNEAPNS